MALKNQGLESRVNAGEENPAILKTIGDYIAKIGDYIANNQMLTAGMVLWLPRLSLIPLYSIDMDSIIGASLADKIEDASWAAASLSYIPWGLHGAELKTYREALEYYRENKWRGLAIATINGLGKEVKFMFWDMPKKYFILLQDINKEYTAHKAVQYLTDLYNKKQLLRHKN